MSEGNTKNRIDMTSPPITYALMDILCKKLPKMAMPIEYESR